MALMSGTAKASVPFAWKDGDRVIVCFEHSEIRDGNYGVYSSDWLRVVAGPLGDRARSGGPWKDAEGKIHSHIIFGNTTFDKGYERAVEAFGSQMAALGHEGKVEVDGATREEETRSWLRLTVDREMVIVLRWKKKKNSDDKFLMIERFEKLMLSEWQIVAQVYADFGTARGLGWTKDPDVPLWPWDPSKYAAAPRQGGPVGGSAPVAMRRSSLRSVPVPAEEDIQDGQLVKPGQPAADATVQPSAGPAATSAVASPVANAGLKELLEGLTIPALDEWLRAQPASTDWAEVIRAEVAGKKRPKALAKINARMAEAVKEQHPAPPATEAPQDQPPAEQSAGGQVVDQQPAQDPPAA